MPRKQTQPQKGNSEPEVTTEVETQENPQTTKVEKSEPPKVVASKPASTTKPLKVEKLSGGVTIETF